MFINELRENYCETCALRKNKLDYCMFCQSEMTTESLMHAKFSTLAGMKFDENLGYYYECVSAISTKYQKRSTAGGLVTQLIESLLLNKQITHFITVRFNSKKQDFEYFSSDNINDLIGQQRSVYTPVCIDNLIDIIKQTEGKLCITAIPSVIKELQCICRENIIISQKIRFTIGLVSGGYKEKKYVDYLAEKCGAEKRTNFDNISFRDKKDGMIYSGENYYFSASNKDEVIELRAGEIKYNWQYGLLKFFPSDFCDDTFNVCSDITVMDGWLPKFKESNGVSLAIVRNSELLDVIRGNKNISFETITLCEVIDSQLGGLRHKTMGLAARVKFFSMLKADMPSRLQTGNLKFDAITFIDHMLRLRASHISRKYYQKIGDAGRMEGKLKKYVFALRAINYLKRKIN